MKGYQIIEIEDLNDVENEVLIPILFWIISNINKSNVYTDVIELKIITVTYLGSYYAIGVRYLTDEIKDVEPVILENFEKLKRYPMIDFLNFIQENTIEIKETRTRLSEELGH